ncbi:hypothetical protein COLO4_33923 [Corchorus olitorius]|uniref:Uncharacterized protein n=1 Tax=Corchorus olitorius TaxID=93759 RepID=A0A1R3GPX2_9ROSI|nr:hypothetical protein COLO4_33923 [Corchorus olitorius]
MQRNKNWAVVTMSSRFEFDPLKLSSSSSSYGCLSVGSVSWNWNFPSTADKRQRGELAPTTDRQGYITASHRPPSVRSVMEV